MLHIMSTEGTQGATCIIVSEEDRLIELVSELDMTVYVVSDETTMFEAISANPGHPVFVDVATFPDAPKRIRLREDGDTIAPGAVVGFASPVRKDVIEAAELFCDEVILRPALIRTLPELATRLSIDTTSTENSW
jgi:hypothetical protein